MIPDESDATTVSHNVVVFQGIPLIQDLIQNRSIPSHQLRWTVDKKGLSSGIQPLNMQIFWLYIYIYIYDQIIIWLQSLIFSVDYPLPSGFGLDVST